MSQVHEELNDASKDGDVEKAKLAIEEGANVNVEGNHGTTPLYWASWNGNEQVVSLLVNYGANINVKDENGMTPLHKASQAGHDAVVSLLLKNSADIDVKTKLGWTPLHQASNRGNKAAVSLLLEYSAVIHVKDERGNTPLHLACEEGHEAVVSLLLEKGADIHAKNKLGDTPLHLASSSGHESVVSLLLEKGANIDATSYSGETPIHYASMEAYEAIVSLLLEKSADIHAKNKHGDTPLHLASLSGHESVVSLLLKKGADPTITNGFRRTPLQNAQSENKRECVTTITNFLQQEFEKKCLENFKTRAAFDRELQRLQEIVNAAKDSLDPDINSVAVTAKANYEMMISLSKRPQYMAKSKLEQEIAKLKEQGRGMDIGEERILVLKELDQLKHQLEADVQKDIGSTPLQFTQERLPEDIEMILTCPLSADIMRDPVILYPSGKTFDRESLCTWLLRNPVPRCPWTNQPLERHMPYVENRDTRDTLIRYLGEEAYQRYDDSAFKLQYRALWANVPTYREIAALLYGMNWKHIDWKAAQEMATNANEDAVIAGIKALLLFPGFRKEKNLQKNEEESRREWERAEELGLSDLVDAGNPWAQWIKGMLVDLVNDDYESAKSLHRSAAEQGHALSQYSLGAFCENDQDYEEAERYYEQAAEQGHALAQYNLAMLQDPDIELMIPFLEQAADQNHAESLFYLGRLYICSDAVEIDYGRARDYSERAAVQGHLEAIQNLVTLLIKQGIGPNDRFVKKRVYELAAERGYALQGNLGHQKIRMLPIQLAQEYEFAARKQLAMLAEQQDHTEALFIAGVNYDEGDQFDMAEYYYEQAAAEGHAGAQFNLAILNEDNHERMIGYLEQAAAQEHQDALYYLGSLYFDSDVVAQDLQRAREYFQRAATQGHTEARDVIRYLGGGIHQPYDDSSFNVQYAALWNTSTYQEISALLYGMNSKQIDWNSAQEMVTSENQEDAIVVGFKALLLCPEMFSSSRLQKDEGGSRREWERAEQLGLSVLVEAGNPWAQWLQGMFLDIVEEKYYSAKELYQFAAEQDHALAQNNLASLYEENDEYDMAEYYYKLASLHGHALAQYNLVMLHDETDFDIMRHYLEEAADQGHASSLYYLGKLYMDSNVEQDLKRAAGYFERAAKQGHDEAQDVLVSLFLKKQNIVPPDNELKKQVFEQGTGMDASNFSNGDNRSHLVSKINAPVEQNNEIAEEDWEFCPPAANISLAAFAELDMRSTSTFHLPPTALETSGTFGNHPQAQMLAASQQHPSQQGESQVTNLETSACTVLKASNVRFSPSVEHRVYIRETDIGDNDVLCGREERGTNHLGNVFYRDIIANSRPTYQMFRSKERKKKKKMSTSIMDKTIKGRFIKQEDDSDRFCLLTRDEVREKISQSLREK